LVGKERDTENSIPSVRARFHQGCRVCTYQPCDKDESGFCFFCGFEK